LQQPTTKSGTNAIMRQTGKSKTCVWRWQQRFMEISIAAIPDSYHAPPPTTRPQRLACRHRLFQGFCQRRAVGVIGACLTKQRQTGPKLAIIGSAKDSAYM
jgi:hypothetical protein